MKTILRTAILLFLAVFCFQACQDQDDVAAPKNLQVQDFIWKGLNQYYLWQGDVPNLSDDRFNNNQEALNSFLRGYPDPETLFNSLRVDPSIDRFSWIVDDYTVLEQELQGTSKNNGIDFKLSPKSKGSNDLIGFVRYILPNSDAASKGVKRGDLFYGINGTQITYDNYKTLLAPDSYTINLTDYDGTTFVPNGKSVTLTKSVLDENPIFINKVIEKNGRKIGYLMYNGFYGNYDDQLNAAFGELKGKGITDLVLDLRYNGGGSVQTATRLASMITGQFTDKVFSKQKWNAKMNESLEINNAEFLINNFVDKFNGVALNSLNLTKVYILTSKSTASASELVINGLKPYIDVIQIGDVTIGKNVGSVTLYDSPTFLKRNVNPSHKYAMQPIVLKIVNSVGFGEYTNGLTPTYSVIETINSLGVLGDENEPLLGTAISKITGTGKVILPKDGKEFEYFTDSKSIDGIRNQMYVDKAPEGLLRALQD
ncbi:S41 family peptidase [Flavobacterium sp. AJR]|uniref:S41 family peptidase n=1 Tax=Flavobacterium sp. AJR TaxID=1979369 RepID=UPI00057EA0E9|nr:S41 family peptidase [Flavobacterium sp. AJR]KIC00940.1 peptidase S41 [Flavobacterium sp. JRM]OUL62206.1 peptidase S41 [Flavobacterium sp. AJR]